MVKRTTATASPAKAGTPAVSAAARPAGVEQASAPVADPARPPETQAVPIEAPVEAGRHPDLPIVQVRSKRPQGRRRSGMAFGPEPVPVDTALLSPLELDALLGDPELIVEPRLD